MSLHIQVITPEETVLDIQASQITIPTTTGEITVLPNHVPVFTQLAPGELTIYKDDKKEHLIVEGGFLEVSKNVVTILADFAIHGKDISIAKVEEAKKRAENKLKEKLSNNDFAIAEAELRKAMLQLRVAAKIKRVNQ